MKQYVRFAHQDGISYGLLEDAFVEVLAGDAPEEFRSTGERLPLDQLTLLPPCTPTKIIGLGANYGDTILKNGAHFPKEPLFCLLPPTSVIGDGEEIHQKPMMKRLACEAELGVVIGKRCAGVPESEAENYIWGYVAANDVTATDLQAQDIQWTRAKSFDSFLPVGSVLVDGVDPQNLWVRGYVNGRLRQEGSTNQMIFGVKRLVAFLSEVMTLLPGDLILTGTPGGYGFSVKNGDRVAIEIERLGKVTNTVKELRL